MKFYTVYLIEKTTGDKKAIGNDYGSKDFAQIQCDIQNKNIIDKANYECVVSEVEY